MERFFTKILSNSVIQALLFLLFLWFLWIIRFILIIVFLAFILSSTLYPFTSYLEQKRFPKWLAIALPYILLVGLILGIIVPLIPFVVLQIQQLTINFPAFIGRAGRLVGLHISIRDLQSFLISRITTIGTNILTLSAQIFNIFFPGFIILFISVYILADRATIQQAIASFSDPKQRPRTIQLLTEIEFTLGAWARGQLLLCFTIGLADFILYLLIGLPYALPLAVLAGILELIPNVGPILAAIPAIIVGITISFPKALLVLGGYVLIQMLEGNFLVPRIMSQAVGIHPIFVILAILIGNELLGIPGALISIPFVSLFTVILTELQKRNRNT